MRGWGLGLGGGGLRRPVKRLYLDNDLEKPANRPGLNRESTRRRTRDEERRGIRGGREGGGGRRRKEEGESKQKGKREEGVREGRKDGKEVTTPSPAEEPN